MQNADYTPTILIVDDLAENIEILGTVLRKKKYKIAVAMNGEGAISIAKQIVPDLILLDIAMPGMDGFTVCRMLKDDPATAGIPVIFLTASADTEDVVTGFSLGAVDYVTKPFKAPELLMRIKTHLTIKKLQRELEQSNLTLEKKVEERTSEIQEAKEKAENSNRLKSEFLSQISHEIRTPLNAVITSAGLIEMEMHDKVDDFLKPLFVSLKSGAKRIIRTVDLILNTAQVHTNSYDTQITRIDLVELLTLTSSMYKFQAWEKKLKFDTDIPFTCAYISGDNHAVTQIFEQLFDNAISYTKEGFVKLSLVESSEHYSVIIEDSGMGISSSFQKQLFGYFAQEDAGYTRPYEGNGLGLALAKKFCEINNASISVQSEKNVGSKFTVVFPKYSV
jgi:signal transduction histidine kinase